MNHSINVEVQTHYLAEQSEPVEQRYVFSYTITLSNTGQLPAQLISRHWIITDAEEAVQEVKGLGVIGQQPTIAPGQKYTYSSGVVLATDTGTMTGSYQMQGTDGELFEAAIPTFALIPPNKLH